MSNKDALVFILTQVGSSYITPDCKKCICDAPQGDLSCTDYICPENEVCVTKDGTTDCSCEPPFVIKEDRCEGDYHKADIL